MLQSTVCSSRHYENISKNKNTCLSSKFVLKGAVTPEINRVKAKKADPNLKRSIGWNKYTMPQFVHKQITKHWEDNIVPWRFICFGKLFLSIEYSIVIAQWLKIRSFEPRIMSLNPLGVLFTLTELNCFKYIFFYQKRDTFLAGLTYILLIRNANK